MTDLPALRSLDVRPNLVDRVVTFFDPIAGARRFQARAALQLAGGYIGARGDRNATREWNPRRGSANSDTLGDLGTLRSRSADLNRNAPLALGATNTVVTNVVGTGLRLRARLDREALGLTDEQASKWERRAERLWRVASKQLDITRAQDFAGVQGLALRSALDSGDLLVIRRNQKRKGDLVGLKLQLVEADRLSNPYNEPDRDGMAAGVETDMDGAPIAYHVRNRHPGDVLYSWGTRDTWTRIPAYGPRSGEPLAILLFDRRRPGQLRGVPYLAPVIEPLKQLERYSEAELASAVISSFFTVFTKTEGGDDVGGLAELDENTTAEGGTPSETGTLKLGPGLIIGLAEGEDITVADPSRPNAQFDPFVMAILRQVGVALELPFEVLIKHFQSSYSAARAALLDAWKFFRARREWLATGLCQPVYGWFITECVATGLLEAPGFFEDPVIRDAWLGAEWIGPAAGQIDPAKEISAAKQRVDLGVSSIDEEATSITGGDFDRIHAQRVKETKMRRRDGLDVEVVGEVVRTASETKTTTAPPPADDDPDAEDEEERRDAA